MPIQCKMIEPKDYEVLHRDLQPGDMYYAPWMIDDNGKAHQVSKEYERDWLGKRPPLVVMLPNRHLFMVDTWFGGFDNTSKTGWVVTGEVPNITLSPSINSSPGDPKGWHGWLQNGILSDDLEGRIY